VFAKLRSGTDIAFVGGMIKYAIEKNRIQQEYVREYTNASWIVGDGYSFADGLFSGFDPAKSRYDRARWAYALDAQGQPRRDPTLKHPRCVFRLVEQHFSRYDADTVCRITGTPKEVYLRVCDLYTSTFAPDRAGTWLYAMGTAQHSHGTQNPAHDRAYAESPRRRHPAGRARARRCVPAGGSMRALPWRGDPQPDGPEDAARAYRDDPTHGGPPGLGRAAGSGSRYRAGVREADAMTASRSVALMR